jgi:excisionase family DNA binding protein
MVSDRVNSVMSLFQGRSDAYGIEKGGKVWAERKPVCVEHFQDHLAGKRLLTVSEAALYLGLSPRTLYNAVAPKSKSPISGLRFKHQGKLVRFDIRDLDLYVEGLE